MSDLIIHNGLAERLREAAHQHNLSVDAFLEMLLQHGTSAGDVPAPTAAQPGTLAALGEAADKANLKLSPNLSERSREILENEFADYLKSRASDGQAGSGGDDSR